MHKVFLSYSYQDAGFAVQLQKALGENSVKGFLDKNDLAIGSVLSNRIREEIKKASAVVVLLSEASSKNAHILFEVGAAEGLRKKIIPIILPGMEMQALPEVFHNIQELDAREKSMQEIAQELKTSLSHPINNFLYQINGEDEMMSPQEKVAKRLSDYAKHLSISPEAVVSLKFRPVKQGDQYTDSFGFSDANAFMYQSEYEAVKNTMILTAPESKLIKAIDPTIHHPHPWSGQSIWKINDSDMLWVQHETGLEIIGAIAGLFTILTGIAMIAEGIHCKIKSNKKDEKSDRYHEARELRIEYRRVGKNDVLEESLVIRESVNRPLQSDDIVNKIRNLLEEHRETAF